MKPLELTVCGFGAFADEYTICFEKFGKNSIFLITGDTGAGKTTIFDAICFALFGKASGDVRKNSEYFRSQFADSDTPTFAQLKFSSADKIYLIKRIPPYPYIKKNGSEGTRKPEAYLCHIDENGNKIIISEKIQDIQAKINTLIGVDEKQFRKIIMIAQGEFQKFLFADSKEKSLILRQLFNTDYCETIQEQLKEHLDRIREQGTFIDNKIKYYLESTCPADEKEKNQYLSILNEYGSAAAEKLCSILEKSLRNLTENLPSMHKKYDLLKQNNDDMIKTIEKGKINNSILMQIKNLKTELQKSVFTLQSAELELDVCKTNYLKTDSLKSECITIENSLKEYDRLAELSVRITTLSGNMNDKKSELVYKKNELVYMENKCQEINEFLENNSADLSEIPQLTSEYNDVNAKIKNISVLKDKINARNSAYEKYEKYTSSYKISAENYFSNIKAKYDDIEKRFFLSTASELAVMLKDDCPCPVCGSLSHPSPAVHSEQDVSKELFKQYKTRLENAAAELHRKKAEAAKQFEYYNELKNQAETFAYNNQLSDYLNYQKLSDLHEKISEKSQALKKKIEDITQRSQTETAKRNTLKNFRQKIEIICKEYDLILQQTNTINQDIAVSRSEYDKIKSNLGFENKEAAETRLFKLKQNINIYQKAYNNAAEKVNNLKICTEKLKGSLTEKEKQTENIPFLDISDSEIRLSQIQSEMNELSDKISAQRHQCSQYEKVIENVLKNFEMFSECQKKIMSCDRLYSMVKGNYSGHSRISFERYIQAYYFTQIIEFANQKLFMLSNGRYKLKRRLEEMKQNSAAGLNLDVIDFYTGSVRNVETLSGGEIFLASLSLALGLSDAMQNKNGSVKIEAMFIDEGFGTLDSSTLDNAVKLLEQLSDHSRMIGIISHISELSYRFDKQIKVEKGNTGSKITVIY